MMTIMSNIQTSAANFYIQIPPYFEEQSMKSLLFYRVSSKRKVCNNFLLYFRGSVLFSLS